MYDRVLTGIVIDPGHGGDDPGAIGNGIIEKDLNLLISKYMYDRFRELDVPVTLTRNTDETLDQTTRVNRILEPYGNGKDVIVLSNHINAGGGDGAEAIYALRNKATLSRTILDEMSKEGQNIRKYYQQRLPSNPIKDYYFIHRDTPNTEAIIIEYGFLDSTGDDVQQLKNNWENYAEAVVRGVMKYKNLNYIPPVGGNYYTVLQGDSLWSIANKFGITVDELKKINNLTSNTLQIGQILKVTGEEEVVPEDYLLYTVESGDSLWSIANKYNTTVATLMSINNLSSSSLKINQQLLIPKAKEIEVIIEPEKGVNYVVKSGDTLYSIAGNYKTTVNAIKEANNLTTNTLQIGQTLIIPVSETAVIEEEIPQVGGINYVVQKGDNLYSIANKYNTTVNAIKEANNLTTNILQIGQILLIPGTTNYATYIVKSGDNLYSIANKYGTTVNKLITINNLVTNKLSIGQELLIPTD
jgi:LysM repeat protein